MNNQVEAPASEVTTTLENCGSESDRHETQSGDIAVDEEVTEPPKEEATINPTQNPKLIQVTEEKESSKVAEEEVKNEPESENLVEIKED